MPGISVRSVPNKRVRWACMLHRCPGSAGGRVRLRGPGGGWSGALTAGGSCLLERTDVGLDLLIALGDELLVVRVGAPCVAQGEQMFAAPISLQSFEGWQAGFDPRVRQCRQARWVALSVQDGVGDGQATESGQIGDGVVQMDVHLVERLLHVQHAARGGLDQAVAMAQQGARQAVGTSRAGTLPSASRSQPFPILDGQSSCDPGTKRTWRA